jgi:hypothetical protein
MVVMLQQFPDRAATDPGIVCAFGNSTKRIEKAVTSTCPFERDISSTPVSYYCTYSYTCIRIVFYWEYERIDPASNEVIGKKSSESYCTQTVQVYFVQYL